MDRTRRSWVLCMMVTDWNGWAIWARWNKLHWMFSASKESGHHREASQKGLPVQMLIWFLRGIQESRTLYHFRERTAMLCETNVYCIMRKSFVRVNPEMRLRYRVGTTQINKSTAWRIFKLLQYPKCLTKQQNKMDKIKVAASIKRVYVRRSWKGKQRVIVCVSL